MNIDKNKVYRIGDFSYQNFVTLSEEQKLMVLGWRNHPDVRKWMFNCEEIPLESHLAFINGLENREDCYYWLVFYQGTPVGVFNIIDCNAELNCGEPGFYLAPEYDGSGLGLDLQLNYGTLFFDFLGIDRMVSHVHYGNTNAYQLAVFWGSVVDGIVEIKGQKYVAMHFDRSFRLPVPDNGIHFARDFTRFCKANPVKW